MVEFYALAGADVLCVVFVYHIIILSNIDHYNIRAEGREGKRLEGRVEVGWREIWDRI